MFSLFDATIPVFARSLTQLRHLIDVAEATGDDSLREARLAPDMFHFTRQIQIACDNAKGAAARLAGIEIPLHADTETTWDELRARIDTTLAFLATITPAQFEGAAERQIVLPYYPGQHLAASDYVQEFALPNFFFHVTVGYAILRQHGVALGKRDFLGTLSLRD